jgi:hypothetical protein
MCIVWCHGLVLLVAIQLWGDLLLNIWKYWRLGITSQKCWGVMKKQDRSNFACSWQFDVQHGMFKLCMKSNFKAAMEPLIDLHPPTQIWRIIHAFQVLTHSVCEYIKLAKVAITHFLTSVKDEWCLSFFAFLKNNCSTTLDLHLALMVGMYCHNFFILNSFSCNGSLINEWKQLNPMVFMRKLNSMCL